MDAAPMMYFFRRFVGINGMAFHNITAQSREGAVQSAKYMPSKLLASFLLLVAGAAGQTPVKSRPSIEAQLVSMGRRGAGVATLTASVKITNNSPSYVFVLLIGHPSAVDDVGNVFDQINSVTGVSYCPERGLSAGTASKLYCVGRPLDRRWLWPVDRYTEIEPGQSASFNIVVVAQNGSDGKTISLTQELAYRVVKEADIAGDATLPEEQKLKAIHLGSFGFNASPGQKELVTSSIVFDAVK